MPAALTDPEPSTRAQELESIQAIFDDDYRDVPPTKTKWGTVVDEGWWEIKLRARDDARVQVTMRGKLGKPPLLSLTDPQNLSPDHVKVLTKAINDKAKASVGSEMIFDLTDFVQDWLRDNHLTVPKPYESTPNLMEELVLREEAKREAEQAHIQAEQERLRAEAAERDRQLNEKIQLDASRKTERQKQIQLDADQKRRQASLASLAEGELDSRVLTLDQEVSVEGFEGKWRSWNLFGGRRDMLWTTFSAEPVISSSLLSSPENDATATFVKTTLPTLVMQIIDFCNPYYSTEQGKKRIDSIATEISRLREIRSDNVLRIYAVKRDRSPKGWERLVVLVDRVAEGGRLRTWLPRDGFPEDKAREYIGEVLAGLSELHRHGATQKQIDLNLTLLATRQATGEMTVKLSGTGYAKKIGDLHRSNQFLRSYDTGNPESWRSPDEADYQYTYTPKRDVWNAGVLLVQLLCGPQVLYVFPDLVTLLRQVTSMSETTIELLQGLMHFNPKKRYSADEALVRLRNAEDVTKKMHKVASSVSFAPLGSPSDLLGTSPNFGRPPGSYFPSSAPSTAPKSSRYKDDFEEVEFLGKGGFGEVVKARNRIDGRSYAIKKVKFRVDADQQKVYREVNNLSRVSHPHIVRYYGCWLEFATVPPAQVAAPLDTPSDGTGGETESDAMSTPSGVAGPSTGRNGRGFFAAQARDESSDIFKPNFDDFSRRDQSRSASFPRIRFTEGSDDDDSSSGESSSSSEEDTEEDDNDDDDNDESDTDTIPDPSEHRGRSGMPAAAAAGRGGTAATATAPVPIAAGGVARRPGMNPNPNPAPGPHARAGPSKPSTTTFSTTDTSSSDADIRSTLYIQMEFVEKQTLREAIGPNMTEEEGWKLLKQVLAGMAHLAMNKIVHRDLKPSNILLDTEGNVKIADFGLSATDMVNPDGSAAHIDADTAAGVGPGGEIDRTSNIGTGLYIAPEVATTRSYDEKADMYSLGVIFFEMCFPFKTQMERVQILSALRQPSIVFPPAWPDDGSYLPMQRNVIQTLLQHDPNRRPTAAELLTDPMMPSPEREQQYNQQAIAALTNPQGEQYPELIDSLFNRASRSYSAAFDNRHDDYTFDNEHDDELQIWLSVVVQRLVQLFQRHGAVETSLPLLMPETMLLDPFPLPPGTKPARLLDQSGKITRLPFNDLLAMARSATRRQIERIKRYHVGQRYAEHMAGGQPVVSGELSFDIISPIRAAVAEAELLEVVDKVISEFRGAKGAVMVEYEFHISHESILTLVLGTVAEKARPDVLRFFKDVGAGMGYTEARAKLSAIGSVQKHLVDELEQCCIVDEFEVVKARLESMFTSPATKRVLSQALEEMSAILQLARSCGITRKILFRPTLSRNAEFFRSGFMFECVRRGKQRDVLAFGGRYDSLLEHFKEPSQFGPSRRVFGVGMSVAVDQLARMVKKYESGLSTRLMEKDNEMERSFGFWTPARCDVYIHALPGVDLATRLAVASELWRAGVKADLQYDDDRGLNEVEKECLDQNTLLLVIPKPKTVKVRFVLRKTEEEVPRQELCSFLRNAIAEQRRIDATYASAEGSIPSAQAAALSVEPRTAELDIKLVLPPEPQTAKGAKNRPVRKHRHATKSVYYDKADEFAKSIKTALPIIGVDLPLPLLSQMTLDASWANDDNAGSEAWRGIMSSLGTSDRTYAGQVRDAVKEAVRAASASTAGAGGGIGGVGGGGTADRSLWLFSVREARGFLLQLR